MPGIDPAVPVIIVLGGRIVHTRLGYLPSGSLKRRLARALAAIVIIAACTKISKKLPGSLIAVL
ncbi:hypothetical protein R6G99_07950, partial [Actinotignum timonense]|nr:hypothetical protein [Actinotignum timonense]